MIETVRNTIEKNIWAWGDISIGRLADELKTDTGTAKLALKHLFANRHEKPPYVIKDGRTGKPKSLDEDLKDYDVIARPENWEYLHDWPGPKNERRVNTKGLRTLEKLGFPFEYGGILEIDSSGKAKLELLNRDHTTLFRGEVDLSDLRLEPGRYVFQYGYGDESAITSPHTIVREKNTDGDIVLTFKRFDMESKGEKVMREKSLHVKPTNEKPEEYPEIKTKLTAKVDLTAKDLKKLFKNTEQKRFSDIVELAIENGRMVVRLKDKWGEEDITMTGGNVLYTTTGSERVKCTVKNLKALVDSLDPNDHLIIHLPEQPDRPLKIVVDAEHISGEYWIAPYVGDNY
jgi:hypothetical protein